MAMRLLGNVTPPNKFLPLLWKKKQLMKEMTSLSSDTSSFSLFARVLHVMDRRVSVVPILEEWGRPLQKPYFQGMVKQLKRFKRHVHALQISMWMSDRRYFSLSPGDLADRLELIYRVHGLEHVENYFNSIPKQMKVYQTYGALLKCYAEGKSVEKAEDLFKRMKQIEMSIWMS